MATPRNPLSAPAHLDRASKELWKRTIEQLQAQVTWLDSDVPLLERYVQAMEVARLARQRIAVRAKDKPESAYTTRGSQGQLVQHPDLKTAREAERDANDYAADLLLTPKARKQHDIGPPKRAGKLEAILGGRADEGGRTAERRKRAV